MKKYRVDEDTILIITDLALEKFNKYRQRDGMDEAGGILLGKIKNDYSEYIIEDISEPSCEDKSSKYSFVRSKNSAQKVINKAFCASNGIIQYLGEWHTHPQYNPNPSITDRLLIKQCSKEIENISDVIFLIIVGEEDSMYVGYINKKHRKLKKIIEI